MKYFIPLESGNFYHIFNRAIGNEKLFKEEANYIHFLKKLAVYLNPIANVYTYVLMPNHFHFLVEIKERKVLYFRYKELEIKKENLILQSEMELDFDKFVMQQFSNFFNSYSKAFNKKYNRKGALFIDYMRRTLIDSEEYLKNIVLYIHQNPIHHGLCNRLEECKYSSYNTILSNRFTFLQSEEVIKLFGDIESFIFEHTILKNIDYEY